MGYSDSEDTSSETDTNNYRDTEPVLPPVRKWDSFRDDVPDQIIGGSGSEAESPLMKMGEKILLFAAYTLTFLIVFCASVVARGTTFFMISQISATKRTPLPFCNDDGNTGIFIPDAIEKVLEVDFQCDTLTGPDRNECDRNLGYERSRWIWCIFFAFAAPNVGAFSRSLRVWLFKFQKMPALKTFLFVFTMEMFHVIGLALLVFLVLPEMDALRAMVLCSGIALIPSILLMFTRIQRSEGKTTVHWKYWIFDGLAVLAQLSAATLWPVFQYANDNTTQHPYPWAIPVSLVLVSCSWWETYAGENFGLSWMWEMKREMLQKSRYYTYLIITPLKIAVFFATMVLVTYFNGSVTNKNNDLVYKDIFFKNFLTNFGNHTYSVREVEEESISDMNFENGLSEKAFYQVPLNENMDAVFVLLIQIFCAFGAYILSKFASKVQIQTFSFAIPVSLVIPSCIALLLAGCAGRADDKCAFIAFLPNNLFFECPKLAGFIYNAWEEDTWVFIIWFLSFLWTTFHIWYPRSNRLASTEQIFGTPWYEGLLIDQTLMLNRRKDGNQEMKIEELQEYELGDKEELKEFYETFPENEHDSKHSSIKKSDTITKIYACATMWHESEEEIIEMLKSLFRIDKDYSARRCAQKYLGVVDQDYYEWETHILFDDCMEVGNNPEEAQVINKFVRLLVETMNKAGTMVHGRKMKTKPCRKFPTPYGGRLVWTLPGKTRIVCHLKDKAKIRHKKRWSQCMYMYYLLGHKLMELPINDDRKEAMAENTYLLALDGDIDFQPQAVIRLVDLMKKNKTVGAACGRIHPTGSGYIPWYQIFEYAVGHWLQKATEHVLGCVLCSPGCFSLFRGKALMNDNVLRKYTTVSTQPRHYVQFDQGEDRWLCTLLLQKGWRVEYSAASDAFTACPVTFEEFFNQRRRWMPSTIMNIVDLLGSYKSVVKNNQDISTLYIIYQGMLMVSTFVGPGAIFLILAGSFNTVFKMDIWDAIIANGIPVILFMLACYFLDQKIQLSFAKLLTIGYILLMLAVMIGIFIQIVEDDSWLSPTAISFLSVFVSFFFAGVLHPYEIGCLPYLPIYYITIPSMYLLLVIYSLFNLWDVSWGTREVAEKKTKAQMEEEKKNAEEIKKNVKNEGMLTNLLTQFHLDGNGGESGGLEFSLANLFKCMCFTHDDPLDPKKQLVEIATSLEKVNSRLSNIEHAQEPLGMPRRSSFSRSRRMTAVSEAIEEDIEDFEYQSQMTEDTASAMNNFEENKIERDDSKNPYWVEDFYPDRPELGGGPVDFLPGAEIVFWNELIKKYLTPLTMNKSQKAEQVKNLKAYRDQLIFTFIMANLIWVLGITLMQQNKDIMSIPWFFDKRYNVTYDPEAEQGPEITIMSTSLSLEPIGLFFLLAFLGIMVLQLIGMVLHRWTNLCHTIATTKLNWCEKIDEDFTEDGDLDTQAVNYARELQKVETEAPQEMQNVNRRNTVHQLSSYHNKIQGGEGEEINLERQFRNRLNSTAELDGIASKMKMRRDTLAALKKRRDSFVTMERRRSTVHFARKSMSSQGIANSGFDSDFGDEETDISGASTYRGSELGRNSLQFDTYVATSQM